MSTPESIVAPQVFDRKSDLAAQFQTRDPFRNVVIEPFFSADFAEALLSEFPEFDQAAAINENGEIGGKATRERVAELGPSYRTLHEAVQSPDFLNLISEITGIKDLRFDPYYFGGGTHENRHGQDLDPHVDFNYHPITGQHRRLNLIVYLNKEWEEAWGGSLDLHENPRMSPNQDRIKRVFPAFNRGVIFETTEWSWHGFERIDLPEEKRHLSRKSFALYYYTDKRPAQELGKPHSTIYVERHLPEHITAGHTLSEEDATHVRNLITRRDHHLKRLYDNIATLGEQVRLLEARLPDPGAEQEPTESADPEEWARQLAHTRRRVEVLEAELAEMRRSTSWRVTAPLRFVKRGIRAVRRRLAKAG